MSIRALELLRAIDLLDKHDQVTDLTRFDEATIMKLLQYYTEKRLEHADQDAAEHRCSDKQLSALISSISGRNAVIPMLPSAFMLNRIFASDPLFRFGVTPDQFTRVHRQSVGMGAEPAPELWRIDNALTYFSMLAPLIKAGILVVLPLDVLHAPPAYREINFSKDGFRSEVPEHLYDFVHNSATALEMRPGANGGLIVLGHPPKEPTRGIAIRFKSDQVNAESFYLLHETEFLGKEPDGNLRIGQKLDWTSKPSQAQFDLWVSQSINRTVIERLHSVSREASLAGELGASYMTESEFEAQLCGMSCAPSAVGASGRASAINFLHANAPYLKIESPEAVVRLRGDNPALFERFQLSLLAVVAELEGIDSGFDERARQLFEREIRPQVEELNVALTKATTAAWKGGILSAATLALAVITGGSLPLVTLLGFGTAMAIAEGLPEIAEYRKKRTGPAFLWKQITD